MTRAVIAAILLGPMLHAQAQVKPSAKAPAGTTVITSFDQDHTVVGWLEVFPFESKILHNRRMIRVLVPANYLSPHNALRTYPVLYMQDGQDLFDETTSAGHGEWHVDETIEHLVGSFKIPPMFVVGIDSAGEQRSAEYLPYPDPRNRSDNVRDAGSIRGKEYARFLVTELMPFIEKHYRIARGATNTGIAGSSYGGDMALYAALTHPGIFGHVLVESPPLWIGDGALLKDAQNARLLPQKMYLGVGTSEAPYGDSAQSPKVVEQVQELEKILQSRGMGPTRLKVMVQDGAQHNQASWSSRLPEALVFLYGK
jgi:predicted alpha/beta superfamily hydrolase